MANPLRDLFFGTRDRDLVQALVPRRTFADVILPPSTRKQLDQALIQIRKHDLLFGEWGLGERHDTGLGLAFNFAGPPGTGKTICAEAIAHALGRRLLVVRYDELESQWAGVTAKNVSAVFVSAAEQEAVLLFDEADAIAARRFTTMDHGYQREANAVVNVLLREVEAFAGVVIFATNLAANFDPAFERRIRTHVLFEMPGPEEREKIWLAQLHARKTPLAEDVDFRRLAERYPASGGDIKNAVLKAAQAAIAEPGADAEKRIEERHFVQGIEEVLASRRVMDQSLFGPGAAAAGLAAAMSGGEDFRQGMEDEVTALATRLVEVEDAVTPLSDSLRRLEGAQAELRRRLDEAAASSAAERQATLELVRQAHEQGKAQVRLALGMAIVSALLAAAALVVAVV
jgi:SpoVK/Ycf46/Vps4 family AAA+-type ATPase